MLLVYDITNEASFRHAQKWLHYVREYAADNIEITLIGNKVDLSENRQVPRQDGLEVKVALKLILLKQTNNF